ncbi:MAG: hypothetical protein WB609_06835 [Candidatus Cybelea sp.]
MSVDLFELLPAIYRIRDAQIAQTQSLLTKAEEVELKALQALTPPLAADERARLDELLAKASRGPLQSLLMLIGEQVAAVAYDIDQLYDDQFIETCAPWVIPYIGDLVGYQPIQNITATVDNPRAEVAETISLRRRKGTVHVMEQLARDITGWGAHAVEMFRMLGDTEYLKHVRLFNHYAPDLRRWENALYIGTGFDRTCHRVDVRSIAALRGRYNIPNIGIFLWSLNAYRISGARATPATTNKAGAPLCYRFSQLGTDMPLFHRAVSQGEQIAAAAQPVNVPDYLHRRELCADIEKGIGAQYYGPTNSLTVSVDGELINPFQIQVANLSGADGSWANLPSTYAVVIDPELGRIALPPQAKGPKRPAVTVSYYYGFTADMGGGSYGRSFTVNDPAWIFPYPDTAAPPRYKNIQDALTYAVGQLAVNGHVALEVHGSRTEALTSAFSIDLPSGTTFELRAEDGARATLFLGGEFSISGGNASTFIINGTVLAAGEAMSPGAPGPATLLRLPLHRPDGTSNLLGELQLTDCTLIPGWRLQTDGKPRFPNVPVLIVEPESAGVKITRAILGSIQAPLYSTITACDSILDATERTRTAFSALDGSSAGAALTLTGCTVVGRVHASALTMVCDTIFWSALPTSDSSPSSLIADRKQQGCVRFSFLPYDAVVPRSFECVEQQLAGVQPLFISTRYGTPVYMKLLASTDDSIRRGASDGGEMGAYHSVLAPQRESDLKIRMLEYLPVGLQFGLIYQT